MSPEQTALVERIRDWIADQPSQREISMFGGRAFLVNDKIMCSAGADGRLLIRTDAARRKALLDQPGASQAEMGSGRAMGAGWISVAPAGIATAERLVFWLQTALDANHVSRPGSQS